MSLIQIVKLGLSQLSPKERNSSGASINNTSNNSHKQPIPNIKEIDAALHAVRDTLQRLKNEIPNFYGEFRRGEEIKQQYIQHFSVYLSSSE
jgi:hypothetical protein